MKRYLLAALAASAFLIPPAQAAVEICDTPNCAPAKNNVLFDKTNTPVSTVTGEVSGHQVLFTSPTGEMLIAPANGQARVEAADGVLDGITFALAGGLSFSSANFNVLSLQRSDLGASLIEIVYELTGGGSGSEQFSIGNGQNKFGVFGAPEGSAFQSITINGLPEGFGFHDLRQVKLGGGYAGFGSSRAWNMVAYDLRNRCCRHGAASSSQRFADGHRLSAAALNRAALPSLCYRVR